jgi:hypothetical protein
MELIYTRLDITLNIANSLLLRRVSLPCLSTQAKQSNFLSIFNLHKYWQSFANIHLCDLCRYIKSGEEQCPKLACHELEIVAI